MLRTELELAAGLREIAKSRASAMRPMTGCAARDDGYTPPGADAFPEWKAADAIESLLIRIEGLEAALAPFAEVADDSGLRDHPDSYAPRPSKGKPNMGDYRRAAEAIAQSQESNNG